MKRADYQADAERFIAESPEAIIGALALNARFSVDLTQRGAWLSIIAQLKGALAQIEDAYVFLEFTIPRMGRRVDAVVVRRGAVFVLEFKVGSEAFDPSSIDQVVGYALDLKNFHQPSHHIPIVPVLVATGATAVGWILGSSGDGVFEPILSNGTNLSEILDIAVGEFHTEIDPVAWVEGAYKPTPTIVEAAQALYRNHRVDEITRNEAGAENLSATAAYVSSVIEASKLRTRKAICFITGVPGSGKTLAGLNIVNLRTSVAADEYAVFLSGNGPLVQVLRAALKRDEKERAVAAGVDHRLRVGARSVEQFIQNVHHFRDANLLSTEAPVEKVVLFDEAQRAWNAEATAKFMRKKRNHYDFSCSEPEFLLSVMDRHDWCTVVCLVGTGQEINTGEAGLDEWFASLAKRFPTWDVHISDRIEPEPEAFGVQSVPPNAITHGSLHLATSIRSFRSESVSAFASALIDNKPEEALQHAQTLGRFEIRVTRSVTEARKWLRRNRRGTERAGILAFSNAVRLKPEGIFVKASIEPEEWFLASRYDVRSCDYLEDCATEFDVQGLELDWICVCLDANLRIADDGTIEPWMFRGTRWQRVNDQERRKYVLNAHRVLLTRARQGVVMFIPNGCVDDPTRNPVWYDRLFDYFVSCGVAEI